MNRTLVKSPPELWPEFSEVERLADHLGKFGEITIRRLEPEHIVVWEGEGARGTVELESSGDGTRVTLTAQVDEADASPASTLTVHRLIPDLDAWDRSAAEIEESAQRQTAAAQRAAERAALRAERDARRGRRLFRGRRSEPDRLAAMAGPPLEPPPLAPDEVRVEPRPDPAREKSARAVLETALDNVG